MAYQRRNFQAGQKIKSADLNAMDMQIEENQKKTAEIESIATSAEKTASDALENSQNWTEVILEARKNATNAATTASEAKTTAINAATTAAEAKNTAIEAVVTASEAVTTATNVASTASEAKTTATNAEATANEAKSLIQNNGSANVFSRLYTNGVMIENEPDALKPIPGDGLKLITNPGTSLIEGYSKKFAKNTRSFMKRDYDYHEVFLHRLDKRNGEITAYTREVIVYGDALVSREDAGELPLRDGDFFDILLSKVTIPAGAEQLTEDMIEDYRSNPQYCGYAEPKNAPLQSQLNTLIAFLYTNGVLEDGTSPFSTTVTGGMGVTTKQGSIVFDGVLHTVDKQQSIKLDASEEENIVALGYRFDRTSKLVTEIRAENCMKQGSVLIYKNKSGTQETLPQRNDTTYDIIHTILTIPKNTSVLSQGMIQDMRHTQAYCGYAKFRMIGM